MSFSESAGGEKCPVTPGAWTATSGYHMLHLQGFLYLLFRKVPIRNLYQGPQKCYLKFCNLHHIHSLLRNTTEITSILFHLCYARDGHVPQGILWFVFLNLQIKRDVDISPITCWLHPYLSLISCNRAAVTCYFSAQYNHASKTS